MRERGRENARERSPDFFGRERNQVKANGWVLRNDFRDGLASIFIDNLSPSVVTMVLWRFFKSFGKVRDVYLSSKKSLYGRQFGFIRFDSMEEAVYVTKKVNEMVIDGERVSAKVASYGWNKRRSVVSKAHCVKDDVLLHKAAYDIIGDRSYAEVMTEKQRKNKEVLTMEWKHQNSDHNWLSKCAAGVLGNFSEFLVSTDVFLTEDRSSLLLMLVINAFYGRLIP
ncbi:hypothetical protein Ddye_011284 [Dipteronia dyeriana]|uniref:RRM domain-containing protein n=1 Tax=Dipteronia dyeriana TaxID=168575 RepID=A0AAD9X284_9ROSI|nr:hypothetical protein Ddye_011284 [Dipteronia dyeriana]